jgi:hypothetical protein
MRACKSLITATLVLLLFELGQSGVCPPCYRDQAVLQGHGPVSSTDNRRKLVIANDVPGINNSKVTSGINGAAQKWNDARDTNSNPPNSYTTPYFFQSGSYEQADFRVVANAATSGPPAYIDLNTYPHEINIRSDVINNLSAADLAAMIAHEVGHRIGLANWDQEPSCPNIGATIMNGSNPANGNRMVTTEVMSNDVFQVNRAFDDSTNMTHCQVDAPTTAGIPECTDSDNDDICAGNDCDDSYYDTTNTCSMVCSSEEEDDCVRAGYPMTWDAVNCRCVWRPGECGGGFNCSPVVVDVLGNGFKLTSLPAGVTFDLDADGTRGWLAWTARDSDDAWLAMDRNGNVRIDNGTELFGNFTPQPEPIGGSEPNGFLALAEYDKASHGGNGDGKIDRADAVFSSLLLWQDRNHNGTSELPELHPLTELGLEAIDLNYESSRRVDRFGNEFRYRSKVTDRHQAQLGRWAWDVFLSTSP